MIKVDKTIEKHLPKTRLGIITANVLVGPATEELRSKVYATAEMWKASDFETLRSHSVMSDLRKAYKLLGADPNRYRPASDSLIRRVIKGNELYSINNVVDIINMISLKTAYSTGGFDAAKTGQEIILTKAPSGIEFEGIGRGPVNIENLPVLKDERGYFGTPTTDSYRTMIDDNTSDILLVYYDFFSNAALSSALDHTVGYLKKYAAAKNTRTLIQ